MSRRLLSALVLPALCLAACASPQPAGTTAKATSTAAKATAKPTPPKAEALTGTAVAPAGMVAAGAGNMVAAGAGNMVAAGAGNMVAAGAGNMVAAGAGNYAVLALEEKPLAGAGVWLVPADEKATMPTREPDAVTDAKGEFTLPVTAKSQTGAYAVVVGAQNAAGKSAPLSTVVEADPKGKVTRVGAATTMVAATLRKRGASAFSTFDLTAFTALVDLLAKDLKLEDLPDFSDPAAVAAKAEEIGKRLEAFGNALDKWGDAVRNDPTSILNGKLPGIKL